MYVLNAIYFVIVSNSGPLAKKTMKYFFMVFSTELITTPHLLHHSLGLLYFRLKNTKPCTLGFL
jgi:hypothetical protein